MLETKNLQQFCFKKFAQKPNIMNFLHLFDKYKFSRSKAKVILISKENL